MTNKILKEHLKEIEAFKKILLELQPGFKIATGKEELYLEILKTKTVDGNLDPNVQVAIEWARVMQYLKEQNYTLKSISFDSYELALKLTGCTQTVEDYYTTLAVITLVWEYGGKILAIHNNCNMPGKIAIKSS